MDSGHVPWKGPSRPSRALLEAYAPYPLWEIAYKEAERSPLFRFGVGAVIFHQDAYLGKGTSHLTRSGFATSITYHAERHALFNARHHNVTDANCLVVALNMNGGHAWSACPCLGCAHLMAHKQIKNVIFAQREMNGSWSIRVESPINLDGESHGLYAKNQRTICR